MDTRTLRNLVYFASGVGLIVSIFAAAEFFDASLSAVCTVNQVVSCSAVDKSGLTTILGVPDYAIGIAGFILILVVATVAEQRPTDRRYTYALITVTSLAVVVSAYLLYVEVALIHALCLVCVSAYAMGVFAWAGAVGLARRPADAPELAEDELETSTDGE
jgi:uncharacterized membrane protein